MGTGWTREYIAENMTLPKLYSLIDYWKQYPPLHCLLAWRYGLGKKPTPGGLDENGQSLFDVFPPTPKR